MKKIRFPSQQRFAILSSSDATLGGQTVILKSVADSGSAKTRSQFFRSSRHDTPDLNEPVCVAARAMMVHGAPSAETHHRDHTGPGHFLLRGMMGRVVAVPSEEPLKGAAGLFTKMVHPMTKALFAGLLVAIQIPYYANANLLSGGTVKGFLSAYNWTSINHYFSGVDQHTFAVGGGLFLATPSYYGFSVAVEPLFQSGLGTHNSNQNLVSPTLGPSFATIGQAYLQFRDSLVTAKVGDMELDNAPWANSDIGYRILPITYQGASLSLTPSKNVHIYLRRITKWRYFNQSTYNAETAYSFYLPRARRPSAGFLETGVNYVGHPINRRGLKTNSELWYYDFYQYDRLVVAQSVNTLPLSHHYAADIGVQAMDSRKSQGLVGHVESQAYGAEFGFSASSYKILGGYDYLPAHLGAFNNGGLVTPYDTITDSGPFFAQPIMSSTQDFGSGSASSIRLDYYGIPGLFTQIRYTYLDMTKGGPTQSYGEWNLLASYKIPYVKGLGVTDILSYAKTGAVLPRTRFYQNRLMLIYSF